MKGLIYTTIIGLCFVFAVGAYTKERCKPLQVVEKEVPMSIIESQQKLIELGFTEALVDGQWKKVKADGIDGPIWRQALNDYYASKHFTPVPKPEKLQELIQ